MCHLEIYLSMSLSVKSSGTVWLSTYHCLIVSVSNYVYLSPSSGLNMCLLLSMGPTSHHPFHLIHASYHAYGRLIWWLKLIDTVLFVHRPTNTHTYTNTNIHTHAHEHHNKPRPAEPPGLKRMQNVFSNVDTQGTPCYNLPQQWHSNLSILIHPSSPHGYGYELQVRIGFDSFFFQQIQTAFFKHCSVFKIKMEHKC